MVFNTRIETEKLTTPSGIPYVGFKVSIGEIIDPATVERTYADIESILKSNQTPYKTHEEKTDRGTFKSYSIETG